MVKLGKYAVQAAATAAVMGKRALAVLTAIATLLATTTTISTARTRKDDMPSFIRDAEIEGLMRLYTRSIFRAAGLNVESVKVYVINDPRINAFVAGGQRIFINTGLLLQAKISQ